MICPVGGEQFSAWQPSMYSTYGERPDGKPYSYLPFPFPLPECPSNKLAVFGAFNAGEVATLSQLIDTAEYKKLVDNETSYYRAYWLATKLGRPDSESFGLLLSAIWQVSPGEMSATPTARSVEQMRHYQETFVDGVRRLKPGTTAQDRLWLEARAANAARQLRQFRAAEQLRAQAADRLAEVAEKRGWDKYLAQLAVVIARRDDGIEPLDMVPERQVAFVCASRPPANKFDQAICARPDIAARVTDFQKRK